MNELQVDRVLKAIVDGVSDYAEIARRAGVEPISLLDHEVVLDRAIQLMRGFYAYAHENMEPAGLPPPSNPYWDQTKDIGGQSAEYYAFEAVQRNNMTREKSLWTCGQLGLDEAAADTALDNVSMPWRPENGWRSYAQIDERQCFVLMDKPPVKLKRHIERFRSDLLGASMH